MSRGMTVAELWVALSRVSNDSEVVLLEGPGENGDRYPEVFEVHEVRQTGEGVLLIMSEDAESAECVAEEISQAIDSAISAVELARNHLSVSLDDIRDEIRRALSEGELFQVQKEIKD